MVTPTHEAAHRLFQEHPEALAPVFESLGAVGPFECAVGSWTTQVTRPFVLGPTTVPEMTDEAMVARNPALAALSAIVHSDSRRAPAILEAVIRGLVSFEPDTIGYWLEVVEVGLENTPVKENWRSLMKTHFPGHRTMFEETYLEGKAEGKAEDRATLILRVLEKHGVEVTEDIRERITSCTDLDTLTLWFDRSLTVTTAADLFTGET